ncbi:MAG: mannose-1-phosphate guanylyltransferase/mannose-6-phosphate isomerase, partial [Pseudohongiellaceae bacterium]
DYAVMEKTASAVVVPLEAGWNDLGAWDAMWEVRAKDEHGNAVSGDVLTFDVQNSYIQSGSRLVAVAGIRDVVVVETADAVLVTHRSQAQSVKHLVQQLLDHEREEGELHRLVYRPWGSYESLSSRPGYQVKHLIVNAGASISLQLHHKRAEHWTALKGVALVTCDNKEFELQPNESTYIPVGSKHRLTNNSNEPIEIIEVQIGEYLGEDDIVRFEDLYNRV